MILRDERYIEKDKDKINLIEDRNNRIYCWEYLEELNIYSDFLRIINLFFSKRFDCYLNIYFIK